MPTRGSAGRGRGDPLEAAHLVGKRRVAVDLRRGDRAEAHDDAAAGLANPERRRPPARPRRELALQFDDWKTAPLTRLKQRIVDLAPAAAAEVAAGDPTLTLAGVGEARPPVP